MTRFSWENDGQLEDFYGIYGGFSWNLVGIYGIYPLVMTVTWENYGILEETKGKTSEIGVDPPWQ